MAKREIRGFLIDLDGTVVEGERAVLGAAATLQWLGNSAIPFRFVTNTTSKPRLAIVDKLTRLDLPVRAEDIFTAPIVARDYLKSHGISRCFPLIKESLMEDLDGITFVNEKPEAVLVGDIGDELTYDKLNRAFRFLMAGAAFIALAENRYFQGSDGLCLDVGSIKAALEYGSQRKATLIGKPSPDFFSTAGASLSLPIDQLAVIGDDLEADVGGGKASGCLGILVRTGKFRPEQMERSDVRPDVILDSFGSLQAWFETRE